MSTSSVSGSGGSGYSYSGGSSVPDEIVPVHTSTPSLNVNPLKNSGAGLLQRTSDYSWVTNDNFTTDSGGVISAYFAAGTTYRLSNLGRNGNAPLYALLTKDGEPSTLLRVSNSGMSDAFRPETSGQYKLHIASFSQDYRVTTSRVRVDGRSITSGSAAKLLYTDGVTATVEHDGITFEIPSKYLSMGRVTKLRNGGSKTLTEGGAGYDLSRIQPSGTVLDSTLLFSVEDESIAAINRGQLVPISEGTTYMNVDAAYGSSFRIRVNVR